ncbi:IS110 family transposase [Halodesulfovibrio aestuarii]|uniref:IS110 family transposase n=1 Tax=Halodesulfovibrio aestuarii TaxID=126333 RepID=A0ABV4JV02_9BACT
MRSIPGIGSVLGLTILTETGDVRRFKHHRQYLKYCGVNLCSYQSGNTKGQYSISKRRNARL